MPIAIQSVSADECKVVIKWKPEFQRLYVLVPFHCRQGIVTPFALIQPCTPTAVITPAAPDNRGGADHGLTCRMG